MIHVEKKELTPRAFIPYQITITVNSQEEHKQLVREFNELESLSNGAWYKFQRSFGAVLQLARTIKSHL